jgi:hypothetical protein
MLAVWTPHCLTTPLLEHLLPPDVGVHALHPRTYSVIDEEILAQEAESIQEDRRGINLKISIKNSVIWSFAGLLCWSFTGLLRW